MVMYTLLKVERQYSLGELTMNRRLLLIIVLPVVLSIAAVGWSQKPAETPATPENIEAAAKISLAAAGGVRVPCG